MEIFMQLLLNSLVAAGIYALIALGFNLIYGTTKFFNLAHGTVAVVGGYAVLYFGKRLGLPLGVSITCGIVAAALVGLLFEKCIFLPLRRRKASSMVLLVAALGAFTALQALIAMIFTSDFQTLSELGPEIPSYTIGAGIVTGIQVIIIISAILIALAIAALLKFTQLGKAIKAVSDDEEVSKIVGINTNRIIAIVFMLGSAIAGWAGIAVGFDTGLQPTLGLGLLLKGVIAAIIGGIGSLWGGLLGALLLGLAENFGIWKISSEWKDAIAFGILILFLIFRPQGILKK